MKKIKAGQNRFFADFSRLVFDKYVYRELHRDGSRVQRRQSGMTAFERLIPGCKIKKIRRAWMDRPRRHHGRIADTQLREHIYVVELAIKFRRVKSRCSPEGGNSTDEAIYLTIGREKAGADGSLGQVAP